MDRLEELRSRFNREVSNLKSGSQYDTDSRTKASNQSTAVPVTYNSQRNPLIQQYQSRRSDGRNNQDSNYDLERYRHQNRLEYGGKNFGYASTSDGPPYASSSRGRAPNDSYHPYSSSDQELQSEDKRIGKFVSAATDPYSVEDHVGRSYGNEDDFDRRVKKRITVKNYQDEGRIDTNSRYMDDISHNQRSLYRSRYDEQIKRESSDGDHHDSWNRVEAGGKQGRIKFPQKNGKYEENYRVEDHSYEPSFINRQPQQLEQIGRAHV